MLEYILRDPVRVFPDYEARLSIVVLGDRATVRSITIYGHLEQVAKMSPSRSLAAQFITKMSTYSGVIFEQIWNIYFKLKNYAHISRI